MSGSSVATGWPAAGLRLPDLLAALSPPMPEPFVWESPLIRALILGIIFVGVLFPLA